jgi:GxxExxY protein
MPLAYKGRVVGDHRVDFLIEDQVIVELKAVESISSFHLAQTLAYLKAGAFQVGLLINFNVPTLVNGVRRLVWSG